MASLVVERVCEEPTSRVRAERASAGEPPGIGSTSTSSRLPSVRVPVLSRQTVSTPASDSTALSCCTIAPVLEMRTAATASVTDASSTRPSGTIEMRPAVAVCAPSWNSTSCSQSAATRAAASGTIATSRRRSSELICSCRGERTRLAWRASLVSLAANASSPTAFTSYSPLPAATNAPESTSSPGCLPMWSDSPVRIDSSRASERASSTVPSASTWSPAATSTTSPGTSSSGVTSCERPSRRTRARGATSSASLSSLRLASTSCVIPMQVLMTMMTAKIASAHAPATTIRIRNPSAIPFTSVNTFWRTIDARLRLERSGARSPRAARARATSSLVRPGCSAAASGHGQGSYGNGSARPSLLHSRT